MTTGNKELKSSASMQAILMLLFWQIFVYGCIAFLTLQINPMNWSWDARFFMVWFGFFAGALIGVGSYVILKKC